MKICIVILLLFLSFILPSPALCSPIIRIAPPVAIMPDSGNSITLMILTGEIPDLGAFDFTIRYKPDALEIQKESDIRLSDDLENADRDFFPIAPLINPTDGAVRFSAYSMGSKTGPSGTVPLALITFSIRNRMENTLNLSNAVLIDSQGIRYTGMEKKNADLIIPDLSDTVKVLQLLCGLNPFENGISVPDISEDGKITAAEAVFILQYVAGLR